MSLRMKMIMIVSFITFMSISCQSPTPDPADFENFVAYGRYPVWSQNADLLAYEYDGAVFEYNLETNDTIRLVNGGTNPSYSPDGSKIVYSQGRNLILFYRLTGDTAYLCEGTRGIWSSDGSRIVYHNLSSPVNDSCISYYDCSDNTSKSYTYFSSENFKYESLYDWGRGDSILHMANSSNNLGILSLSDGQVEAHSFWTGYSSLRSFDWCEKRNLYLYSYFHSELEGSYTAIGLRDTSMYSNKIITGPSGGSWSPSGDSIAYSKDGGIFIEATDSLWSWAG